MSTLQILNEDWSDYDNRKIRDNRDGRFFACSEEWERNYLKAKIKKYYPRFSDNEILAAIAACCGSLKAPYHRKDFVECVIARLGLR